MPSIRPDVDPALSSSGARRRDDAARARTRPDRYERPTVLERGERPSADRRPANGASAPGTRFLADSGRPGDEVRLVLLRGTGGEVTRGAIRGPLPSSLSVLGEEYELSRFSQVDAEGAVVSTYRASSGPRSAYR